MKCPLTPFSVPAATRQHPRVTEACTRGKERKVALHGLFCHDIQCCHSIEDPLLTHHGAYNKEAQRSEEVPGPVDGDEAAKTHHSRHEKVVEAVEHARGTPPHAHYCRLPHGAHLEGER